VEQSLCRPGDSIPPAGSSKKLPAIVSRGTINGSHPPPSFRGYGGQAPTLGHEEIYGIFDDFYWKNKIKPDKTATMFLQG
jgi:hypothetical protein